ncbi:hypothetical protein QJS66_14635 [Kocuria rhizophila]|nr:hypothetical protein QJS66_14635 [Kocuria rhizophila]
MILVGFSAAFQGNASSARRRLRDRRGQACSWCLLVTSRLFSFVGLNYLAPGGGFKIRRNFPRVMLLAVHHGRRMYVVVSLFTVAVTCRR